MTTKLILFLNVIGLIICQPSTFAQTPNYTGTWVLNLNKSKFETKPEGMTSSIFKIKQTGSDFSLTIHHIFGNAKDTIVLKMTSDGKTRQVLNSLKGKLEQKTNYLRITLWQKDFLDKVDYKFGNNVNEFIADELLKSTSDNHHNIWVFDRESTK